MASVGFGAGIGQAPGIYTREIDLTTTVPAGASSQGAFAGLFNWGPTNQPVLIGSEDQLVQIFGKPTNHNAETWFTAANFLAYGNQLWVNRAADTANAVYAAVSNTGSIASRSAHTIENDEDYDLKKASFEANVNWIARYAGTLGNSLRVSAVTNPTQYSSTINLHSVASNTSFGTANTALSINVGSKTATISLANTGALAGDTPMAHANTVRNLFTVGDYIVAGNTSLGTQNLKIVEIGAIAIANSAGANTGRASFTVSFDQPLKIAGDYSSTTVARKWEFASLVAAPSTTWSTSTSVGANTVAVDGMSLVVVDRLGEFTGRPGAVLEIFENVSRANNATTIDNESNYVVSVINTRSKYIRTATLPAEIAVSNMANVATTAGSVPYNTTFVLGTDGTDEASVPLATLMRAYDVFANKQEFSISSVIAGKTRGGTFGEQLLNYLIDNVVEPRSDAVVYGSPAKAVVVNNGVDTLADLLDFRGAVRRSSYGFLDSGYKYQYDKYNNVFRFVPLCGDTAGLSARVDIALDPWYSPAGYNRGQIKNIVRLSYNPANSGDQAVLFTNDINPVVTTKGDGTYLLGDKTLLGQSSALNQLGIRKMLNILKTAISNAAKVLLYEFNDEFTQARFKGIVDPYLRDVRGRRGLKSYAVVCDDTNNTEQVVNSFQFVGDIYLVPNRSIRTIHLNFIVVNGVATFTETLL